ncbi:hypothetical protein PCE1_000861 [Barthelona sp. PCE]
MDLSFDQNHLEYNEFETDILHIPVEKPPNVHNDEILFSDPGQDIHLAGYLRLESFWGSDKERYIVVQGTKLKIFIDSSDEVPKHSFSLENCNIRLEANDKLKLIFGDSNFTFTSEEKNLFQWLVRLNNCIKAAQYLMKSYLDNQTPSRLILTLLRDDEICFRERISLCNQELTKSAQFFLFSAFEYWNFNELELCNIGLTCETLSHLSNCMNKNLTKLSVVGNNLTVDAGAILSSMLKNSSIVSLDLSDNPAITDVGFEDIIDILSTNNRPMSLLNVSNCGITSKCMQTLLDSALEAQSWDHNIVITTLNLSHASFDTKAMQSLHYFLRNQAVHVSDLIMTHSLTNKEVSEAFISRLSRTLKLFRLDIRNSELSVSAVNSLGEVVQSHPNLKEVMFNPGDKDPVAAEALVSYISPDSYEFELIFQNDRMKSTISDKTKEIINQYCE